MANGETEQHDDTLILRFVGEEEDGSPLHELRAAHVAEVLQGVVGLAGDFGRAGAFGDGPAGADVLVRPAREGSFIIEVVREVLDEPYVQAGLAASGFPTLSQVIWWATRSARADVSDISYLENGNVKVSWQDNTVDEVPKPVWEELNKRKRRRKKHLQQLMTPLSEQRVTALEVVDEDPVAGAVETAPTTFTLDRDDYNAAKPDDEVDEKQNIFEVEAQMSAIDFDDPSKWRVKTKDVSRSATLVDSHFLSQVNTGLPILKDDIFTLKIREDEIVKNGRTRRKWTVLEVKGHKRSTYDDDGA
jgi:hypothetical protein